MKTIKYFIFLFFVLLSVDGYAQSKQLTASPRIGGYDCPDFDLREVFEPIVIHETFDTRNGRNVFGNDNNEVCFAFTLYRPAVFLLNCNGSSLENIDAHLLYYPLDESADDFVDVSDPITEDDWDELEKRLQLLQHMNVLLDENILHGWMGTHLLQILQPGHYVLYGEGDTLHGSDYNGMIRSNIYINPVGISQDMPMDIGDYSEDFNFKFSGSFEDQDPIHELYFSTILSSPMNLHVSSKGTQGSPLFIKIMDDSGNEITTNEDFSLENDSFPQIEKVRLKTGTYLMGVTYRGKEEIQLSLMGKLDFLKGDKKEDPIQIEIASEKINYQKTFQTSDYSDFYHGKSTKDIFHCIETEYPMDIIFSVPYCAMEGGATLYLIDENNKIAGILDTSKEKELSFRKLESGTYYLVLEGNKYDGEMTLCVQGMKHYEYTPSSDRNYIISIAPSTAVSTDEMLNNPDKARHVIDYYDLLGRQEQTVLYAASPTFQNHVTYTEYDGLGREYKKWLPAVTSNLIPYISLPEVKNISLNLYSDACAYNKIVYETSPLNRIVESYGAGEAWQDMEHGVKNSYRFNTSKDHCRYFTVSGDRNLPILLQHVEEYPLCELAVKETKDEDGHTSYLFIDKLGHTLLERMIADADTLDTYYVYDDYANLCFVLPPMAVDSLTAFSQEILDCYAYQYRYDYRNRCIGKKIPGCGWTESIYDYADRLVFTQDGEQRKRNEWSVVVSDQLSRSVITGIYKGIPDRKYYEHQSVYAKITPDDISTFYGYTLHGLPTDSIKVLQVSYFDTYDFKRCNLGFTSSLDYVTDERYGTRYDKDTDSINCKGLSTGSILSVLETGQQLFSCTYYDFDKQPIQVRSTNLRGKTDIHKSVYDFTGQVTAACEEYDGSVVLEKYYTYDHMGRLIEEVHSLNRLDSVRFIHEFDQLGRTQSLTRKHGESSFMTENHYNIRNWLTSIKSSFFKQTLHYTDGTGRPCYNGNISSMTWSTDTLITRGYNFTYDGLSRLKDALYGESDRLVSKTNHFNEQITEYDKLGNILGLKRYGQISETEFGLIDNLKMDYVGNQLQAVTDNAVNSVYGNGFEFKDGARRIIEYTYDTNGNLKKDLNKKITDIQYNYLNLSNRIQFEDGSTISYIYSADGTKLRTIRLEGEKMTVTDYCGNAIYENGVLDKLLTGQGYITLSDTTYHYFLQDHQGNNRVVMNQDGAIEEENHYYPFGGVFAGSSIQSYKYNGKELDRSKGLDWYDYGARMYDAALGRWHVMDPLSEKYYNWSPNVYCANNPMRYIDPTGLAWRQTYTEDQKGNRTYNGYEWVPESESYNENGTLKRGLYVQAIFFSDNGTFESSSIKNMGSSTATVYLADGTTQTFDANTKPSSEDYPTVPEGIYHATVGKHKGQYVALRMSDINDKGKIELGIPNPAHPGRTYADGVNIHKPADDNLTGLTRSKKPISAGCLLIDINNWSNFINLFNNDLQKRNTIGITVSRSMSTPINGIRLPAFNFILNGRRDDFFKTKFKH